MKRVRVKEKIKPGDDVGIPEEPWARPEPANNKPLRTSRAKPCKHCGHAYLAPCDEARKKTCGNWLFLQRKK